MSVSAERFDGAESVGMPWRAPAFAQNRPTRSLKLSANTSQAPTLQKLNGDRFRLKALRLSDVRHLVDESRADLARHAEKTVRAAAFDWRGAGAEAGRCTDRPFTLSLSGGRALRYARMAVATLL